MAPDYLFGRMADERAEAVRTARPRPWALAVIRHPTLFAVLFGIVGVLGLRVLAQLFRPILRPTPETSTYGLEWDTALVELTACVLVIALLVALGWWRSVGFTGPRSWRSVHLAWFAVLMLLLILTLAHPTITTDTRWLAIAAPYNFLVGFYEEALLRGLVLFLLLYAWRSKPHGVLWAVVGSSALFGIAHLSNMLGGQSPGVTLTQVGFATFIGIGLAGLALRTNTLWLGVIWHGLVDSISDALPGPLVHPSRDIDLLSALAEVGLLTPMMIYGLILIRSRARRSGHADTSPPTTAHTPKGRTAPGTA